MLETKTENGIDVERLIETMKTIKDNPELGIFKFRAHNEWLYGGHGCTKIKDFYGAGHEDRSRSSAFVLESDEPDVLLGSDHAPNATEAVLHALASCLQATLVYQAAARHIKIEKLEFELEGVLDMRGFLGLDDSVRNGYQRINIKCKIKANAPDGRLAELLELAQKRSPVFDIVTHGVPVSVSMEKIS